MSDPLTRGIAHFNREEYRDALLAFEERWSAERSDFLRALIQLCNALNQLRLGLVSAPRRNLASASLLLASSPPRYEGVDVDALRAYIQAVQRYIPEGLESGEGRVSWEQLPRLRLEILPPML